MTESDIDPAAPPARPRWVKVFVVLALIAAVLLVAGLVFGGGDHSPRRHFDDSGDESPSTPHSIPTEHAP